MAPRSALVLSPEAPYPLDGGGALRTASLLQYLACHGPVDLILFRQPGGPDPARELPPGLVRRVSVIALPAHRRGLPARAVRNLTRLVKESPPLPDRFAGFAAQVMEATGGRTYDVGLIEHSWCAPYWEQMSVVCRRTVLDLHNIESVLHRRCAESEGGATAFAHHLFGRTSRALETAWLPRYSQVLAPSEEDAETARSIAPLAVVSVYPNAIPLKPLPAHADEEVLVFSGNMEYHPNLGAVRFFREEAWPRLRDRWPGLVWRLVGKNPQAVRELASGDPRIELYGPVDDAVGELARCRVAVVPLRAASGTRFKILEAWAAGIPVVSTAIGAEGLGARDGETLLLADGAEDFVQAVGRLLENPSLREQLGMAGRRLLEREFTWESAWKRLHL